MTFVDGERDISKIRTGKKRAWSRSLMLLRMFSSEAQVLGAPVASYRLHGSWFRANKAIIIDHFSNKPAMYHSARLGDRVVRWCGGVSRFGCMVAFVLGLLVQTARAEDASPELDNPPVVCSAATAAQNALQGICEVTPLGANCNKNSPNCNKIKVNLTAETAEIEVGGYKVITENYRGKYLPPVIEAMPGDTVAAHLENSLEPRNTNDHQENPTNLHFFHGGIVTPNNARPPVSEIQIPPGFKGFIELPESGLRGACAQPIPDIDAGKGNGDNIYVHLKNGKDEAGNANSFDYCVPIPGKGELDAGVLERKGFIPHPLGLNWYHSHLHEISSDQVMGGLSGLLSVGEDKANVRAKCAKTAPDPVECDKDNTAVLKDRTDVRYVLLRDISLRGVTALPEEAKGETVEWAPQDRDFNENTTPCKVFKKTGSGLTPDESPKLRKGFCHKSDNKSAWLFTLNGQRFPTITVGGERNLLLRIGNLSANVAYWLELCKPRTLEEGCDEIAKETLPLTVLSLDGVVPAKPVDPEEAKIPVDAFDVNDLLLMPASRAEIYVRNDIRPHDEQVYILRTKKIDAGTDVWPEIQLARVVLQPNKAASSIALALNAPIVLPSALVTAEEAIRAEARLPDGCVRDLDPKKGEHRRITFNESTVGFAIATQIVRPPKLDPTPDDKFLEKEFERSPPVTETEIKSVPFEAYEQDGTFDWVGKHHSHVCIRLDHEASHKQLWVLVNNTGSLHNFHIHQMKFRLATRSELRAHHIEPPPQRQTCKETEKCREPDYNFFEEDPEPRAGASELKKWHDTIPIPALTKERDDPRVFLIMSFDAQEQIGRFVFHCHILKHEDTGLMAPIEVWDPKRGQTFN